MDKKEKADLEKLKKSIDKVRAKEPNTPQVCPHCGRCPVCGRKAEGCPDYPGYPYPWTVTWWSGAAEDDGVTTYTA